MNNCRRMLPLLLLLLVVVSGCRSRVDLNYGAPYASPYRIDESVIVSFPDEMQKRTYKVKVGGFFDAHVYIIPVGEAYASETTARMKGIFTGAVTLTSNSMLDQLAAPAPEKSVLPPVEKSEDEEDSKEAQQERDLEAVLSDLTKVEKGEKLPEKKSQAQLTQEALEMTSIEMFRQRDPGYLLRFQDAIFGFDPNDSRCRVSFRVQYIDWRTKNILFDKRYSGQSQRFKAAQSQKTNETNLRDLVRQAMSGTMTQLVEDIAIASDARRY